MGTARDRQFRDGWTRLLAALGALVAVVTVGGLVLYALGGGRWSAGDALYFAINAVSTVGFRELDGMDRVRFSRVAIIGIIAAGLGTVAYFQSSLTALLVQGVIGERFRFARMQRRIDSVRDHVIVAGAGSTGMHVVEELAATRATFVVIDRDRDVLERISRQFCDGEMLFVVGDATDDATLVQAGVTRAMGVVAALTEDKDNLYVTLSARSLNASARIATKVIAPDAAPKMMRAGANVTVSPNMIGGRRLASELVRPTVLEFMDQMLRDHQALRLEEVTVAEGSQLVGRTVRDVPPGVLVVALRVDGKLLYSPEPSTPLEAGSVVVVVGASEALGLLRALVGPP